MYVLGVVLAPYRELIQVITLAWTSKFVVLDGGSILRSRVKKHKMARKRGREIQAKTRACWVEAQNCASRATFMHKTRGIIGSERICAQSVIAGFLLEDFAWS
jgi:hypothetical protein